MSTPLQLDESAVRAVVEEVMRGLGRSPILSPAPAPSASSPAPTATASRPRPAGSGRRFGVFEDVNDACAAAQQAF